MTTFRTVCLLTCLISTSINTFSQVENTSSIHLAICELDSLLFEEGFNNCDLDQVDELLSSDFEFYHDQNGIQNRPQFINSFEESLCSTPERKPIRKLVSGSMEVFPLYNEGTLYGAIQQAQHEFLIKEPNTPLYKTSVASFTHLWLLDQNEWKLKRSLSFDHQAPPIDFGPQFEANYNAPLFNSDHQIEALLKQHNIPSLAIGYITKGELQQVRLFGSQSPEQAVNLNTIYKVASLTKPITAIITLKLIDQGRWNLDEPLSNYFVDEDVKDAPELDLLTTRHVLSHRSGFPNWRYMTETNQLNFDFKPGSQFSYSGEGFEYLRKSLEAKFGKGLEELTQELLFTPLGMQNTHFSWDKNMDESHYAVESDEHGNFLTYSKHMSVSAAANLMTTIGDYGRFMTYLMAGADLSEELFTEFITPHSSKKPGIDWGLGCELLLDLDENGEYAIMHGGGDYGLKTLMVLLPNSKQGLVIFSNSENGMVVWRKIIEEYFGEIGAEIARRNLE